MLNKFNEVYSKIIMEMNEKSKRNKKIVNEDLNQVGNEITYFLIDDNADSFPGKYSIEEAAEAIIKYASKNGMRPLKVQYGDGDVELQHEENTDYDDLAGILGQAAGEIEDEGLKNEIIVILGYEDSPENVDIFLMIANFNEQ